MNNTLDIMEIGEAAEYLHIKKWTLYRLVKNGKVPGTKIGGQWRFKKEVLDAMFSSPIPGFARESSDNGDGIQE